MKNKLQKPNMQGFILNMQHNMGQYCVAPLEVARGR